MRHTSRWNILITAFALTTLLALGAIQAFADTAGPNLPGSASSNNSIGTIAWSNPLNAQFSDQLRAEADLNDLEISHYLVVRNFSFAIPSDATIDGIVVDIERQMQSGAGTIRDHSVKLLKNGIIQGDDRATTTIWSNNFDANESHGGSADLWGSAWTPADINSPDFGVAVSAIKNNTAGSSFEARIDNIRITIHYTPAGAPDITPPVVTVPADMTVEATGPSGATVTFSASASDDVDGALPADCDPESDETFPLGTTTVDCEATDSSGNTGSSSFDVTVEDTTAPDITMLGSNPVTVNLGDIYADDGATASDIVDGDLTASIVTVNLVDTGTARAYFVTYDVTDSAGNPAATVTRTVNVVDPGVPDITAPVITLVGSDPVTVEVGSAYVDDGATALDDVDGDITGSIVTVNPVDTAVVGAYTVTYDVTDSSGNAAAQVTRTVNVAAAPAPAQQPDNGDTGGLGPIAFSHFAPRSLTAPSTPQSAPAAAPSNPASAPSGETSGGNAQIPANSIPSSQAAPQPTPGNAITGNAVAEPGNLITGGATAGGSGTGTSILITLAILIIVIIGGAWAYHKYF